MNQKKMIAAGLVLAFAGAAWGGILEETPAAWFCADTGVETNTAGGIVRWRNQGTLGNALDLAPVAEGAALTVKADGVGGKPAIAFNGTTHLASAQANNLGMSAEGGAWFAVYRAATNTAARGNMGVFALEPTASGRFGAFYPIDPGGTVVRSYFNSYASLDAMATYAPKILSLNCRKNGNAWSLSSWLDGVKAGESTAAPNAPWSGKLLLGQFGYDWTKTFSGEFAELRVYNRPLTDAERAGVEESLSARYGVPIGTNAASAAFIRGVATDQPHARIVWTRPLCKEPKRYIGWPTIARRRNGELLAVFSGDRDVHICPWGKVQLVRSADGGETWSAPETVVNGPLDDRDAGIMELANGDLVVTWFTSLYYSVLGNEMYNRHYEKTPLDLKISQHGYFTVRSTDNGRTWSAPVPTASSAEHGGIQLRDGRLMMVGRAGEMTGMPDADPRKGHLPNRLCVEESRDNAASWQVLATVTPPAGANIAHFCEPHLAELPNGRIVAQFRIEDGTSIVWQMESVDGGRTWSTLHPTPLIGFPPHLLVLRDGRLLATTCCRDAKLLPLGIYAWLSDDGGMTWKAEEKICLCRHWESDMGYTSSVQLDDGSIITAYYMRDVSGEGCCLMGTKWTLID